MADKSFTNFAFAAGEYPAADSDPELKKLIKINVIVVKTNLGNKHLIVQCYQKFDIQGSFSVLVQSVTSCCMVKNYSPPPDGKPIQATELSPKGFSIIKISLLKSQTNRAA